jgi:uncharacterized protein (TIGR03437 family)
MRLQLRLNLRRLVLALVALLSFGAILLKQSDGYLRASAAAQTVVSVNAASYEKGPLARGSLASVFGNNLAAETETSKDVPPPTKLGGVTVEVIDSGNVKRAAGLVMVSPQQINYVIQDEAALGKGKIVIMNGSETVATGELEIVDSKPALFTSGSGDSKFAVGTTSANGANAQSIVNPDGSPRLISSGALWAPNTLTLLGTGIRYASDVRVRIGDKEVAPTFVGPDATPGVDRVDFKIPMTLRGGTNTISLVANTRSSAAAPSGATTFAAGTAPSSDTTVTSNAAQAVTQGDAPPSPNTLSAADVQLIIAQAVAKAQQIGFLATIAVVDQEGNVLGIFKMTGARSDVLVGSTNLVNGKPTRLLPNGMIDPDGLEQVRLPLAPGLGLLSDGAALAAISKAGTAAFFSTQGSAISTRTASFIIQENFPPTVPFQMDGPLFGVQFSSLPCSDVRNPRDRNLPNLPLGLAGDAGGMPIYKNGLHVGAIGIEGDGFYSIDTDPKDIDPPSTNAEEIIAVAGIKGFRVPQAFQIDNVQIDGKRLPFTNVAPPGDGPAPLPFGSLPGTVISVDPVTGAPFIRGQQVSGFIPLTLGGIPGRVTKGFFPFKDSQVSSLTAGDVNRILIQAAQGAYNLRAAIRLPVAQPTEVNIAVIDTSGAVLGLFSTQDAPNFGFDVSVQKARNALFFSLPNAAAQLSAANANVAGIVPGLDIAKYAPAATAFGVPLNGQFAFSARAMGFLARPNYPPGINGAQNGPFSKDIRFWSPFNTGLQLALVKPALVRILTGGTPPSGDPFNCSPLPNDRTVANGLMIFAGSVLLFKNGVLVGAIGVSGDGIDQDEDVAATGSFGFEAPPAVRADQLILKGARLPYYKLPRHPNIGNPPTPPIIRSARVFSNTN